MKATPDSLRRLARLEALGLDLLQMSLDLVGIVDPTPVSDGASALISLARGDWLGAGISGASAAFPYLGDAAKALRLPRYTRVFDEAVLLAKNSRECTKALLPYMEKLRDVLRRLTPTGSDSFLLFLRLKVDEFFKVTWVYRIPRSQLLHAVRGNGSGAGQLAVSGRTVNVHTLVDMLENIVERHPNELLRSDTASLLDEMAKSKWRITAGRHRTPGGDETEHITLNILDIQQQYHLRLDRKGHVFEIRHPQGTALGEGRTFQKR
jgi:hypothetical protein